jgi:uncharacterized RDD family membrane protein YckC
MYCSNCGAAVGEGAAFCSSCGRPASAAAEAAPAAAMPAGAPAGAQSAAATPQIMYAPPAPAQASAPQVAYAGFWLRFVAIIIDAVVLWFLFVPILAITGLGAGMAGALSSAGQSGDPAELISAMFSGGLVALLCLSFVGRWLYFALMESSTWQATLGKKALGLYVTDMTGQRIAFGQATGRYFGKIISGLVLGIGFIMAGFTARKQALHDLMAGCLVLRKL